MKAGERVLDLACGYGRNSLVCKDFGLDVTGLDLSRDLLSIARQKKPGK